MKFLVCLSVVVFATIFDLLFGGGHYTLMTIEWLRGTFGSINDWGRSLFL